MLARRRNTVKIGILAVFGPKPWTPPRRAENGLRQHSTTRETGPFGTPGRNPVFRGLGPRARRARGEDPQGLHDTTFAASRKCLTDSLNGPCRSLDKSPRPCSTTRGTGPCGTPGRRPFSGVSASGDSPREPCLPCVRRSGGLCKGLTASCADPAGPSARGLRNSLTASGHTRALAGGQKKSPPSCGPAPRAGRSFFLPKHRSARTRKESRHWGLGNLPRLEPRKNVYLLCFTLLHSSSRTALCASPLGGVPLRRCVRRRRRSPIAPR